MDVHQWVEPTLLNLPNIFLKAVPAYEATEAKVITFISHNVLKTHIVGLKKFGAKFHLLIYNGSNFVN